MDQLESADKTPLFRDQYAPYGESKGETNDTSSHKEKNGLGFWQTFLATSGIISGFSITVLMTVIIYTGWFLGIVIYVIVTSLVVYTASLLGNCWNMTEQQYRDDRRPYGAIAQQACGKWARMTVNVFVDLVSFGTGIMILLVVSDLLYIVIGPSVHGTFCYWPMAFGLVVLPFMWLGTFKDSWQIGALSFLSCALAMMFLLINGAIQISTSAWYQHPFNQWNISLDTTAADPPLFYLGWLISLITGCSMFMLTTHFAIPTIQRGMNKPDQFNTVVVAVYSVFSVINIPTLLVVYFAFGHLFTSFRESGVSILYILPRDDLVITPALLLLLHGLLFMVPINNPLFQHFEEMFNIPEEFGWKRMFFRTLVVLLQIFCAETLPQFSVFMAVIAAVLIPPLTFLAPSLFYLRLRAIYDPDSASTRPLHHKLETVACVSLIALSPAIMILTSAVTIEAIADGETLFVTPCYVDPKAAHI